jgi:hypothetical protein
MSIWPRASALKDSSLNNGGIDGIVDLGVVWTTSGSFKQTRSTHNRVFSVVTHSYPVVLVRLTTTGFAMFRSGISAWIRTSLYGDSIQYQLKSRYAIHIHTEFLNPNCSPQIRPRYDVRDSTTLVLAPEP